MRYILPLNYACKHILCREVAAMSTTFKAETFVGLSGRYRLLTRMSFFRLYMHRKACDGACCTSMEPAEPRSLDRWWRNGVFMRRRGVLCKGPVLPVSGCCV